MGRPRKNINLEKVDTAEAEVVDTVDVIFTRTYCGTYGNYYKGEKYKLSGKLLEILKDDYDVSFC